MPERHLDILRNMPESDDISIESITMAPPRRALARRSQPQDFSPPPSSQRPRLNDPVLSSPRSATEPPHSYELRARAERGNAEPSEVGSNSHENISSISNVRGRGSHDRDKKLYGNTTDSREMVITTVKKTRTFNNHQRRHHYQRNLLVYQARLKS